MMIIKPNAFEYRSKIIQLLRSKEFNIIVNKKLTNFDYQNAQTFFQPYFGKDPDFKKLCQSMTNGSFAVVMVSRPGNCVNALRQFTEQIQSMYSKDDYSIVDHAVYTSSTVSDFWRDRSFFFFHDSNNVKFQDYGSELSSVHESVSTNPQSVLKNKLSQSINAPLSASFELNPIEETIFIIKPHLTKCAREIEGILLDKGFFIGKSRRLNMPKIVWTDFYSKYEDKPWFNKLCEAMAEDQIRSYILYRVDAINYLKKLIGPTDPNQARITAPYSLRANPNYGKDMIRNGFHCSDNEEQ